MGRLILVFALIFSTSNHIALSAEAELPVGPLAEVVNLMSQNKVQAGQFTQERTISGLSQVLTSSGQYYIQADMGIVWQQILPFEDLLVVKENKLYSQVGMELVAQEVPSNVVALMTDIFSGLMTGDPSTLQRQFELNVVKEQAGINPTHDWSVVLRPKFSPLDSIFDHIDLVGKGSSLKQIGLIELSGDSTKIELTSSSENQSSTIKHWLDLSWSGSQD
ncbi:LolA family protein [Vibrio sp. MA40-2]|uniref:LolA family protein n=1 Tax=Vibrio sp. MA40-2 TaxID=3391828 RepID=UPI0039A4AEA3